MSLFFTKKSRKTHIGQPLMEIRHAVLLLLLAGLLLLGACHALDALDRSECERNSWRKSTLKLIKEMPFSGLFR